MSRRSPRPDETKQEKADRKAAHMAMVHDEGTHIKEYVANLSGAIDATVELDRYFHKYPKETIFTFADDTGRSIELVRKDISSFKKQYKAALKHIPEIFHLSKKRKRSPPLPSSFKGTYNPVFAATNLQDFFKNVAGFGHVVPNDPSSSFLIDQLSQTFRNGYLQRAAAISLFFIYLKASGLRNADNGSYYRADDAMMNAFANAGASLMRVRTGVDAKGRDKYSSQDFFKLQQQNPGLQPQSVFAQIQADFQSHNNNLNLDAIPQYTTQMIVALSTYSAKNLADSNVPGRAQIIDNFSDAALRRDMLDDYDVIRATAERWAEISEGQRKPKSKKK